MLKKFNSFIILCVTICSLTIVFSFSAGDKKTAYAEHYLNRVRLLHEEQIRLIQLVENSNLSLKKDRQRIQEQLQITRNTFKPADFWLRYFNPIAHKKINGPLPVEWETEVFEKSEKPYKREGAGFTLTHLYLNESNPYKNVLLSLLNQAKDATAIYTNDSITRELTSFHHFYFCNRLFLLNLAAIYTTGFECPDTENIIPELKVMLSEMRTTYQLFNQSFPQTSLTKVYLTKYEEAIRFVNSQDSSFETFDHFTFIREYVNPLYTINSELILQYKASSHNTLDYTINKQASSIFSKALYNGQNPKGIFLRVQDSAALVQLNDVGKLLFYDPILSQNNQRSCVSCHNSNQFFTDTSVATSTRFDREDNLPRNTPSLLNAQYNHLIMADGKHLTLMEQTKAVITNPAEMGSIEKDVMQKVLSCKQYAQAFSKLLKYTPQEKEITFNHIASAITYYYCKFSQHSSPFDEAVNKQHQLSNAEHKGFNLFMSKAQCATCHFVPQFNGVKPPYIGSEFEVLGVPKTIDYASLSNDEGRYTIYPAEETLHAFRTGTIRNTAFTQPYMHNGVFKTLTQVVEFYNNGGGIGHHLSVPNQTLSGDSLQLTDEEQKDLLAFIQTLTEKVEWEPAPVKLPSSNNKILNQRTIGGTY